MHTFTIGADPEVFFTDGIRLVSAIGRIPGTKETPHNTPWGNIHADNVAAEFNIPAQSSKDGFDQAVKAGLDGVASYAKACGLEVSADAFGPFSKEELSHPYALVGGCDPDFNAYTGTLNPKPFLEYFDERAAGGHVHIGTEITDSEVPHLVKVLDLFLGIPLLERENPDRRQLYGKAGSFRRKPYGLEYRTPSNAWIFSSNDRKWVYEAVDRALSEFKSIKLPENIPHVIDKHDLRMAQQLMQDFRICPL